MATKQQNPARTAPKADAKAGAVPAPKGAADVVQLPLIEKVKFPKLAEYRREWAPARAKEFERAWKNGNIVGLASEPNIVSILTVYVDGEDSCYTFVATHHTAKPKGATRVAFDQFADVYPAFSVPVQAQVAAYSWAWAYLRAVMLQAVRAYESNMSDKERTAQEKEREDERKARAKRVAEQKRERAKIDARRLAMAKKALSDAQKAHKAAKGAARKETQIAVKTATVALQRIEQEQDLKAQLDNLRAGK